MREIRYLLQKFNVLPPFKEWVKTVGAVTLRDYLSFETLAANREALEAFRDANYLLTAGVFILAYVLIVGFSLPGATIATLTGGFLFGVFPGALFPYQGYVFPVKEQWPLEFDLWAKVLFHLQKESGLFSHLYVF